MSGIPLIDVFPLACPISKEAALDEVRLPSKLFRPIGNLPEFSVVGLLNQRGEFPGLGQWVPWISMRCLGTTALAELLESSRDSPEETNAPR